MKTVLMVATYIVGFALKSNEVGGGLFVSPTLLSEAQKHLANSKTAGETVASIMQNKGPEIVDAVASWVQNQTQIPTSLKQISSELVTVMNSTSNGLDAGYIGLELRAEMDVSVINPGADDMMFFVIKGSKVKFCWGLAAGVEPHIPLEENSKAENWHEEYAYEVEIMLIGGGARYDSFQSGGKGRQFWNNSIWFLEAGAEMKKKDWVRGDITVGLALNEDKPPPVFMVGAEIGPDMDLIKPVKDHLIKPMKDNIKVLRKYVGMLQTQDPSMFDKLKEKTNEFLAAETKMSGELNTGGMWCTPEI